MLKPNHQLIHMKAIKFLTQDLGHMWYYLAKAKGSWPKRNLPISLFAVNQSFRVDICIADALNCWSPLRTNLNQFQICSLTIRFAFAPSEWNQKHICSDQLLEQYSQHVVNKHMWNSCLGNIIIIIRPSKSSSDLCRTKKGLAGEKVWTRSRKEKNATQSHLKTINSDTFQCLKKHIWVIFVIIIYVSFLFRDLRICDIIIIFAGRLSLII